MPNHCENKLTVSSDFNIDLIMLDGEIDFKKIVKPPNTKAYRNEYKENQREIRDDPTYWRNWNVENWGTKWNGYDTIIDEEIHYTTDYQIILFQTAWSPAIPAIKALAIKYPDYIFGFEYVEYGMNYAGHLILKGDEIIEEEEYEPRIDMTDKLQSLTVDILLRDDDNYQKELRGLFKCDECKEEPCACTQILPTYEEQEEAQ